MFDEAIPEPPWRRAPRGSRQPRQPLTREAIVAAALEILDAEGLDAINMRRVAAELGTGAGSLYWHVNDKDELLELLFDQVVAEIRVPDPEPDQWRSQVKEVSREIRRVCLRHGDVARIALDHWPVGPNALVFAEGLLAILRAGGLPDRACAWASGLIPSYVGWFALEEYLVRESQAGDEAGSPEAVQDYLASLPAARFPNLFAVLGEMASGDADERFEFGLDVLVSGLAAQVGHDTRSAKTLDRRADLR